MSPSPSFERLRERFEELSSLPETEREAALSPLDAVEARALREMLVALERSGTPLDSSPLPISELGGAEEGLPRVPGYRLTQRIGTGGSATVFLARQDGAGFSRDVALKVVDRLIDADSMARVRDEQKILARLEHPGIARLYDAGQTAAGQPYLAIENVQGKSIVTSCRDANLPFAERLRLFIDVLEAVQYAHEQGVVHRDLKPGNILVSEKGGAKLLDFGIARLHLDPGDEDETVTLHRAMTPAYASPEQVRGERVTAASDLYSLGVVLYEALTGVSPYSTGDGTPRTLQEAICTREPEAPSSAYSRVTSGTSHSTGTRDRPEIARRLRLLRYDLDAVLLKALRKEPGARYGSAREFAGDLRRVLAGQPVEARRGNRRYRLMKLTRRHWPRLTAAALLATALPLLALPQLRQRWLLSLLSHPATQESALFENVDGESPVRGQITSGAAALRRFDGSKAAAFFRQAIEGAPAESRARAVAWDGLSRAEELRGETGAAADAARQAAVLAYLLPEREAARVRARGLLADEAKPQAIAALTALYAEYPGRVDIGLDLVTAHYRTGLTQNADAALGRLRQLHSQKVEETADPRVDLAEAEVAYRLSEFQRAAAAAQKSRLRAEGLGAREIALRAERLRAQSLWRLDRPTEAKQALASVIAQTTGAGLQNQAAAAGLALAAIEARTTGGGDPRFALDQALSGARRAGDRRLEASVLMELGVLQCRSARCDTGVDSNAQALGLSRELGDRWMESLALAQRYVLFDWSDRETEKVALIEPMLRGLRESGNRRALLNSLTNLALGALRRSELDRAEAYLDEGASLAREVGAEVDAAQLFIARGGLEMTRGLYDLARRSYGEALAKAQSSKAKHLIANASYALAMLELTAEQPKAAETWAIEAVSAADAAEDPRVAADAEAILAWAEARQGNRASAERRFAALEKAVGEQGGPRFTLLTLRARTAEALKDWPLAIALRRHTVRIAEEWKNTQLVTDQRHGLARALYGSGERKEFEMLARHLLAEADATGQRGVARELRVLLGERPLG